MTRFKQQMSFEGHQRSEHTSLAMTHGDQPVASSVQGDQTAVSCAQPASSGDQPVVSGVQPASSGDQPASSGVQAGQHGYHSYPYSHIEEQDERNKQLQRSLEEAQMQLTDKEKEHQVHNSYTTQIHQQALASKNDEIDRLQVENKTLKGCNEALRTRNGQLEDMVQELNISIAEKEVSKRDHDACLQRCSKLQQEREALRDDRERVYRENVQYENQAREMSQTIDLLRERIADLNNSLCVNQTEAKEQLEKEALFWKNKCESEEKEKTFWKHKYTCEQEEHQAANPGFAVDAHGSSVCCGHQPVIMRPKELFPSSPSEPKRKRRFTMEPTNQPYCKNCKRIQPAGTDCDFHMAESQPYKIWMRQVEESARPENVSSEHRYWPCCEKISIKTPAGCRTLHKHEIITPDDDIV